ncbi:MAG: hypothetical protein RR291_04865, partial [Clostridia bacterium]
NGDFHIGDFHYKFLTGFPNFTLALNDIELKDKKWNTHHHTLLKAKEIDFSFVKFVGYGALISVPTLLVILTVLQVM